LIERQKNISDFHALETGLIAANGVGADRERRYSVPPVRASCGGSRGARIF
jgi:hypothetical protein